MIRWRDISVTKKLYSVVGIMAILIVGELLTLRFAMRTLSSARAFVGGEGLWSKSQKNAALALERYAITRNENDYAAFLEHLKVPEGDHIARLELMKKNPDFSLIEKGFLQGGIHKDDIAPMTDLIRSFYWISYLSRAIEIWTTADVLIEQFKTAGVDYHHALQAGNKKIAQVRFLELKKLNEDISPLEEEFSYVLGAGSRWLEYVILALLSVAVLIVESIGLGLTLMTSRAISNGLSELNETALRLGRANFIPSKVSTSNDEIGHLGRSLNKIGKLLEGSYQAQHQLDIILKGITDGITVIDNKGQFVFVNEMGAKMCGFDSVKEFLSIPQSEMIKYFEILDEKGNPTTWDRLPSRAAFRGEVAPEAILCFRSTKTGELRWSIVKSAPIFDEANNTNLVVTIFKDFTEHKRAEEEAKFFAEASRILSSSLDYEKTLQNIASLVVPKFADWCAIDIRENMTSDPKSVAVAHVDPKKLEWARSLGEKYPTDWSDTKGPGKILMTGESQIYPEIPDQMLVAAAKNEEHLRALREVEMKSVIVVALQSRGKIFGRLTLVSSSFGKKYTSKELQFAEELARRAATAIDNAMLYKQAQNAIQARDEFLSIASHELNTPITSLSLQMQLMERSIDAAKNIVPPAEKLEKVIEMSSKQIDRLAELVADLLDASRIRTGKFSFNFEKINLSEVIHDMLSRFSNQLNRVHSTMKTSIEENIVGSFDTTRIQQVIDNLISNAIKYAPGKPIEVSVFKNDMTVTISVQDYGPGIPKENHDKIFKRFERASSATHISGLGLGLFIVKEIVAGHSGNVRVESELGKGSKFVIELPLNRTESKNG